MTLAIAVSQEASHLPSGERSFLDALRNEGIDASPMVWSREADWASFNAVVIRSCWDYHLRIDEFLAWIARLEQLKVTLINQATLMRWNANKRYLADLAAKGIAIPETHWLEHGEEVDLGKLCRERSWPSAVAKPLVSASAYRTERRTGGIVQGPIMIQQYIAEIEESGEWSLVYFGGMFSHAVRKLPRAGEFRVQQEFGGTVQPADPPQHLRRAADAVMDVLAVTPAIARVDLVSRASDVLLMELELIEPEVFLHCAAGSAERLVSAIKSIV